MKSVYYRIVLLWLLLCVSGVGSAQILAWQFALPEPSTGREKTAKATTNDENLEFSVLTRGPGAVAKQGNARGFSGNFPVDVNREDAQRSGAYYQFTVKAKKGFKVSLSSLETVLRRQAESAHIYRWMYSLNGKDFKEIGPADVTIKSVSNNGAKQRAISLSEYEELQNVPASVTITLRLYAWGGVADSGNARAFGFGKSSSAGSNALALFGAVSSAK